MAVFGMVEPTLWIKVTWFEKETDRTKTSWQLDQTRTTKNEKSLANSDRTVRDSPTLSNTSPLNPDVDSLNL